MKNEPKKINDLSKAIEISDLKVLDDRTYLMLHMLSFASSKDMHIISLVVL